MKFFILISILLSAYLLFSQDSIFLVNGDSIIANVHVVSDSTIEYTQIGRSTPIYVINKSKITKITYSDGYSDNFIGIPIESKNRIFSKNVTLKGNNVFVISNDRNSGIQDLNSVFAQKLSEWGYWNVVEKKENADFIIEIIGVKKGMGAWSWGARVNVHANLQTIDGSLIFITPEYEGNSNGTTGYNSLSNAINKLLKKCLMKKYN